MDRAQKALERAKERLAQKKQEIDELRAQAALKRAILRLTLAERYRHR